MTCKSICQTALLAKPSKTHNLLEVLCWQRSDLKWCRGCGYNRPVDREYWHERRGHCHAWSNLKNDMHQFSSAEARYDDHELDVNMWIEEWCSAIAPGVGTLQRTKEDQWCPSCRAQWNWEMSVVEAALIFDIEFQHLKKQESSLKIDWWGKSVQLSTQEPMA